MAWLMGIDIGSETSKGLILRNKKAVADSLLATGIDYGIAAEKVKNELIKKVGITEDTVIRVITTGQGDGIIPFSDQHISDTQCCAKGMHHIHGSVRTIIDVQSQSSQIIKVNSKGQVIDFIASEKCASGSGRFLKVIANILQMDLKEIGAISLESINPVTFTTACAVFGESEAISRVAEGIAKEDILAGVHMALAKKINALINRIGLEEDCAISGGGGMNIGLIKKIEEFGYRLIVPFQPQFINALGAAIFAAEQVENGPP